MLCAIVVRRYLICVWVIKKVDNRIRNILLIYRFTWQISYQFTDSLDKSSTQKVTDWVQAVLQSKVNKVKVGHWFITVCFIENKYFTTWLITVFFIGNKYFTHRWLITVFFIENKYFTSLIHNCLLHWNKYFTSLIHNCVLHWK